MKQMDKTAKAGQKRRAYTTISEELKVAKYVAKSGVRASLRHKVRSSGGVANSAIVKAATEGIILAKDANLLQVTEGESTSQRIGQIGCLQEWGMSSARQQQRLKCLQPRLTMSKPSSSVISGQLLP